ncbi:hypothetical protein [Phreatobacter oligotrophus]|uniref:Uncharacterized protein n=1 Tax=Phreatobacter oligotrophus TaxID=1122261 RepID=A0A2T4Z257_9HYPH|nr:hypothetical protein [Phreatobacter oligotrophus]PTM54859.1 hypothetical protein C8P69_1057 [Phreatobacter oligotrophus]
MTRAYFAREEHLLPEDEAARRMIVHGIHEHLSEISDHTTIAPEWRLTNALRGLLALQDYGARALADVEADGIRRALDDVTPCILAKLEGLMPMAALQTGLFDFRELVAHHTARRPSSDRETRDLIDRAQIFENELHNVSLRKLMERRAEKAAAKALKAAVAAASTVAEMPAATPTTNQKVAPTDSIPPLSLYFDIGDEELDLLPPDHPWLKD